MSAVVAYKKNGRVYMAADRLKIRLDLNWLPTSEFNFKIHKLKNGILIGAVGPLYQVQKLYLNESWFNPPKGVSFDKRFIATSIIPKYVKVLCDFGALEERKENSSDYPHVDASFIIVKDEDIFYIDGDFGVFKMDDVAVAADSDLYDTYTTLCDITDDTDPEAYLERIFRLAADTLHDTSPEIVLIDTVNTEFRLLGGKK